VSAPFDPRRVALCLVALAAGWSGAACSSDFESSSRLTKLRMLAVRADRPFARPGERVRFETLVVDPAQRALQWASGLCINPSSSTADACLDALQAPLAPWSPESKELAVEIPGGALEKLSEQARASAAVGLVLLACPGELREAMTGKLGLSCHQEAGALGLDGYEVGVKRVFVRERDRNANPEITRASWDGEAWPEDRVPVVEACDSDGDAIDDCPQRTRHRIAFETSQPERGRDEQNVAFSEQMIVQYYASEGVFEHEVRIASEASNSWAARSTAGGGRISLWFVVRDNRGGVGWISRQVEVR
jgi:hypothetical protein